ncbi:hypothetical protein SASPL_104876 [Salvia splendens]|uniref:AtC3H23-like CCCH zinc finger domain-containing protein n=1 Tax=Salvia splendens TaxID=180675 RepID=A0A8X8YIB4_SALSN|nr:zinc finger CCCH domain-containing protein 66-like [Salvia splendens]KAG6433268.1 hypothetical protein SASPL_104876 [Salvia splendens]
MCLGSTSTSNFCPFDTDTDSGFGSEISHRRCSKLLELAAADDLAGFIREIEERGVDVNASRFWYGSSLSSKRSGFMERTPIMIASLYGSTNVLNYLIETCKVDVNKSCGSDAATALHCAAAAGAWSSIEILISASADINAVDASGKKPGELIAPCVKSSIGSKRRLLDLALNSEEAPEKKESLPDINSGVYGSDEFRTYDFKVRPCARAYSHDWTECPFVHPGESARRRDPRKYGYTCVPCPEFRKGGTCEYANGVFESWLHPAQYRTRLCKDEIGCARKVCFFAHKPEDLRPLYAMPSPNSLASLTPLSLGQLKLKPLNLDEFFGSVDPSMMSLSPKVNGLSHMRASYPSNNQASGYGFDSAIMNSRASAFSKRSQSFGYSRGLMAASNWDGKVDWGFNGEDVSKLRKSASFSIRSAAAVSPSGSVPLRRGVHEVMPLWVDQMYVEQE